MLQPLLASLLLTGAGGPPPPELPPPPSLTATLAAAATPIAPPPQQGYEYGLAPQGWVSFGVSFLSTDLSQDTVGSADENNAIGGEIGFYGWQGEMGLGLEVGLIQSTYEAQIDALASEDVDAWRATLGVRLADRGSGDRFLPWLRGGFLYRFDNGTVLGDDGPGFYIGGGFDFRLVAGLALSPQLVYQQSNSFDSKEWLGTLSLTYLF